jgi:hypothetical protein
METLDVAALNAANSKARGLGARGRCGTQKRLRADVRQQLLKAIYNGRPFREALGGLGS